MAVAASLHAGGRQLFSIFDFGVASTSSVGSAALKILEERSRATWNFDFRCQQPLVGGRYEWTPLSDGPYAACSCVDDSHSSCVRRSQAERRRRPSLKLRSRHHRGTRNENEFEETATVCDRLASTRRRLNPTPTSDRPTPLAARRRLVFDDIGRTRRLLTRFDVSVELSRHLATCDDFTATDRIQSPASFDVREPCQTKPAAAACNKFILSTDASQSLYRLLPVHQSPVESCVRTPVDGELDTESTTSEEMTKSSRSLSGSQLTTFTTSTDVKNPSSDTTSSSAEPRSTFTTAEVTNVVVRQRKRQLSSSPVSRSEKITGK